MSEDDDLGQRIAHLEGVVEAEEKAFEHDVDSLRHGQILLIAIIGLVVAGSLAVLVYLLNRMDVMSLLPHAAK